MKKKKNEMIVLKMYYEENGQQKRVMLSWSLDLCLISLQNISHLIFLNNTFYFMNFFFLVHVSLVICTKSSSRFPSFFSCPCPMFFFNLWLLNSPTLTLFLFYVPQNFNSFRLLYTRNKNMNKWLLPDHFFF